MSKRIIPFTCFLLAVVSVVAQDLRTSKITIPKGLTAMSRVPCTDNTVGGPITFDNEINGSSNSIPGIGETIFLCADDELNISNLGIGAIFGSDADNTTQPGVGLAVYDCEPTATIDGPTIAAILADGCLLGDPVQSEEMTLAIDFDDPFGGNTTFVNSTAIRQALEDPANPGAPFQRWFAPITFDGIVNNDFTYEGNPEGACVSVGLDQAFSVVYLNPIAFENLTYPFSQDRSQARLNIKGGLPEFNDAQNYTFDITNINDPSVKGSVKSGGLGHRDFPVIQVPCAGTYRIEISDGRSCALDTTLVMDGFEKPQNPVAIIINNPTGVTGGQEFCTDVTVENFDSIIGGTFFICWDTDFIEFQRVDNVIDGSWLFGENLASEGAIITNWSSQDFIGGTSYPDGSTLFSLCFLVKQSIQGTTNVEFCTEDPRPNSNNPPDIVTAAGGGTQIPFPDDPENNGQPFQVTDPNALNVLLIEDEKKDACVGDNNGSFAIQILGGTPPYEVVWRNAAGDVDGPIMVNEQDGIATITNLAPGDYTYEVFDGGVPPDRRFSGELGPVTIEEADLGVNIAIESEPTCFGDSNGSLRANVSLNSTAITDLTNYDFVWLNEIGDTISREPIATGLPAGNDYQVYVFSNNGCTESDLGGDLTQPGRMSVTPSPIPASCSGVADGIIGLNNVIGGTGPYDFVWSDGNTGADNINIESGKYIFTVTDNGGCELVDSLILGAENEFRVNLTDINPVQCFGMDNGSIDVSAEYVNGPGINGAYTFQWSANVIDIDNTVTRQSLAQNLAQGSYSVTLTNEDLPGCQAVETFEITEPDSLIIEDVQITNVSSCSLVNPDGGISVSPTGGTIAADYTYEWRDTANASIGVTDALTGQPSGPVLLTVTDDKGCEAMLDTIIGTPPPPEIQFFDNKNLNCFNDDTDLQVIAVPGRANVDIARYEWSHDATISGANANNVGPGVYYVRVIDTDQCATVDSAIVDAPEPIQTNGITFQEPCFATAEGTISIDDVLGGTPSPAGIAYNFEWKAEGETDIINSTSTLSNVESGNYVLSIIDANDCKLDTTITLNHIPKIEVTFDLASVTGVDCFTTINPADCNGSANATAAYEGTGDGTFTFTWGATGETSGNTATSFSSNSLCAGMQALRVTDGQCEVIDSVNIPSPAELLFDAANASVTPANCFGDNNGEATLAAMGGTGAYTFTWPDGGNEIIKTGLAANLYQITITDANDCIATHEVEVTQPDAPLTASIDPDNTNDVICEGDNNGAIAILVDGGNQDQLTYTWTNNVSTINSAAGLAPGPYTIDVVDAKNCMASVTYTVAQPTPITASVEWDPIQCNGFQTGIRITNPSGGTGNSYSFSVDNSPARPLGETITEFGGDRLISVFDEAGCREDINITIPQPRSLEVSFADNLTETEVDLGSSTTLDLQVSSDVPIAEIFWTQNGGALDSAFQCSVVPCLNPTVNPLDNTSYTAFVTDVNGCMNEASILVEVDKNRNIYIPNVFAPNNAGFDTNDRFEVFAGSGVLRINYAKVFNRWGTMVADVGERRITSMGEAVQIWDGFIKGEKANQGVYIYLVEVEFIDGQTLLYRGDIALLR